MSNEARARLEQALLKERDQEAIDQILTRFLAQHHYQDILHLSLILKHWQTLMGASLAPKTRPSGLAKGRLTILTADPAYAAHLSYYEAELLQLLTGICGPGVVKAVKFTTGAFTPLDPKTVLAKAVPLPGPALRPGKQQQAQAAAAAEPIADARLRKRFQRAMAQALAKQGAT